MLNAIYELNFFNCLYGYRLKRSCHQALETIDNKIMLQKVNFVIDADIRSFFDNVDHEWLMEMLQVKIADKNFFRIIKRFLLARVRENGNYNEPTGVPLKAVYAKLIQQIQRVGEYRRSRIRKNLTSGSVRGMTNSSH